MLPKPTDCIGCPWYGDGLGFVPDRIPPGAKVVFLLQNPGKNEEEGRRVIGYEGARHEITEECPPQPLIGPTGFVFHQSFLPLSSLDPAELGLANVLRCRMQTKVLVKPGREAVPDSLDESGNVVPGQPAVEPVYEIERSNKMPTKDEGRAVIEHCTRAHLRIPDSVRLVVAQGAHAWRLLGGPQPLDDWRGYLMPEQYGSALVHGEVARPWPVLATLHLADLLHRPKMDLPTRKDFLKIGKIMEGRWPWAWPRIHNANTMSETTMVDWFNAAADAPFVVIDTEYDQNTKELSLLGVAVPEEINPVPVIQLHWWQQYLSPGRRSLFLDLLLYTVGEAGVPAVFQNVLADMPVLRKTCGLSWSSFKRIEDTMQAHAVLWCELPHDLEFQASMDSRYNKTKHLMGVDMDRYNAGDLMDTICSWQARLDDFSRDPLSRKVYDTQMLLLPHLDRSMEVGIAVDQEKVLPAIVKYRERAIEGERMAHAYCGWPINLNSDEQLKVALYEIEKMPVQRHPESKQPTTNADAIAILRQKFMAFDVKEDESMTPAYVQRRIAEGAHPLLEAHVLHAHADHVLGHYLLPLVKDA